MMKCCPKCNGRGTVGYFHIDHFVDIECPQCHGSGEVSEVEMTNEEWFCQLSTEEKAHQLHLMTTSCYVCGADGVDYKRCYFRKECTGEADIEDWLKAVRKE